MVASLAIQTFAVPSNTTNRWVIVSFDERSITAIDVDSITKDGDSFVIVSRSIQPRIEGKQIETTSQYLYQINCNNSTLRNAGGNVLISHQRGWTRPEDYDGDFEPVPPSLATGNYTYRVVCELERDFGREFADFSQIIATHSALVRDGRTNLPW